MAISSDSKSDQITKAMHALAQFARLLVKEYPLAFDDESGTLKIVPSKQHIPYEVLLTVKKKSYRKKTTKQPGIRG